LDSGASLYNALNIGRGTSDSGSSLISSNKTNISDLNGLVFSYNGNGILLKILWMDS
jgi:hypothetical protein